MQTAELRTNDEHHILIIYHLTDKLRTNDEHHLSFDKRTTYER